MAGVSTLCFFASYGLALILEISRLFYRVPIRVAVMITFVAAGLLAHSVYLWLRVHDQPGWHVWCLLVAWVLTTAYFVLSLRYPQTAMGIFMLPLVLALIGVAELFQDATTFSRAQALTFWGVVHGMMLLLGTAVVMLGFVAGAMYLLQSYRLKQKLPPREGLQLPSLERLQKVNEWALIVSSILLVTGLVAGIVHNLIKSSVIAWTDPVVWISGLLLAWLAAALTFNYVYKPARHGRKVAYLVLASFVVLALVLGIVLLAGHANSPPQPITTQTKDAMRNRSLVPRETEVVQLASSPARRAIAYGGER